MEASNAEKDAYQKGYDQGIKNGYDDGYRKAYDETIENVVLNDKYSWNSLYVFAKYRFKKPESIPFVDTMDITLKSPHKLHIKVYEKGPIKIFWSEIHR